MMLDDAGFERNDKITGREPGIRRDRGYRCAVRDGGRTQGIAAPFEMGAWRYGTPQGHVLHDRRGWGCVDNSL